MTSTARRWLWLLFWAGAALSAVVVVLFLWAAIPVVAAIAQGGRAQLWFFGYTGYAVGAAALYLVVVACVLLRRVRRRSNSDSVGR